MKVRSVEVAPSMSVQMAPGAVLITCHWTLESGLLVAAELKVTETPASLVWLVGWTVTTGLVFTVRIAGSEVAEPAMLVATAR